VRLFRALVLVSMVLGAAGWLMADILDPTIRLAIPGTGTFDLCTVLAAGESCTTTLINGKPDTTIGDDGFGSFAVKNVDTTLTVDSISFEFQTNNLFQPFSAFTDDFHTVNIVRHFNEGCIFDLEQGCLNPVGMLEVDFFDTPKPGTPGSFSLPAITCDFEGCPTAVGFVPHTDITVVSEYKVVPDPQQCCDGIQPGEEAGLSITSDVPEPGSFVLLLGAAGLLAIKRRFKFHRG
jgi:hypothetical protein